jgi:hypothetical protein
MQELSYYLSIMLVGVTSTIVSKIVFQTHTKLNLIERTIKMQPCNRIYYSNVS